jgi:hypothetical protein
MKLSYSTHSTWLNLMRCLMLFGGETGDAVAMNPMLEDLIELERRFDCWQP